MNEQDLEQEIDFNDSPHLMEVETRARAARMPTKREVADGSDAEDPIPLLVVTYPCGRDAHQVIYDGDQADQLLKHTFEGARFLPVSGGLFMPDSGRIEALLRVQRPYLLRRVAGVKQILPSDARLKAQRPRFQFSVRSNGFKLDFGPPSKEFLAIGGYDGDFPGLYTLELVAPRTRLPKASNEADELFRTLAMALLFELDTRYGVVADILNGAPEFGRMAGRPAVTERVRFPRMTYPLQPLSLYQYGRTADHLPLLAFLAYYQVLEFFFPIFTQAEAVRRVRNVISDPRFSVRNDVSVLDVVQAARHHGGFIGEREQLLSTIGQCTSPTDVANIVSESEESKDYFTTNKRQPLQGMMPLRLADEKTLLNQVSERIYNIRCRIVHTKADGGDGAVELLLPDSPEVRELHPDVELVRRLAELALIAGGNELRLP